MKKYINLLIVMLFFTSQVFAAVTTTQKVIAPATTDLELDATTSTNQIIAKKKVQFQGKVTRTAYNDPTTGTAQVLEDHTNSFVRLTGSGLVSVKGIPAGNLGDSRTIVNETGADVIILNQDATATAAMRIDTGSSKDVTIKNNGAFQVMYDTVTSRWHMLSGASGGGISNWVTGTSYKVGDVVIQSSKIYQALLDHTSGTFATDLAAADWTQIAKNLTGLPQYGSAISSLEELQVPNNQFTLTATNKFLIENCGNSNNILYNCGFEHSSLTTNWVAIAGTSSTLTTNIIGGLKAHRKTYTAAAVSMTQDSTLYQDAFTDGIQGVASMYVRTSVTSTPLYMCPRQAGAFPSSLTSRCATIIADGKWHPYRVPFTLGATSNGVGVTSNGVNVSGTVDFDHAYAGISDLKQDVLSSYKVGSIKFSGCSSNFASASTTYASMGTNTSCTITTTGSVTAPATQVLGLRLLARGAGKYSFVATGEFGKNVSTTNSTVGFVFRDTTNSVNSINENILQHASSAGAVMTVPSIKGDFDYTSTGDTSFEVFAKTSTTTSSTFAIASPTNPIVIDVYFYPSQTSTSYSSTNADFGWTPCTTTGSWVSNTTYTCLEKRVGDTAHYDITVATSGAPTATTLSVNLPNSRVIDTSKLASGSSVLQLLDGVSSVNDSGTAFSGNGAVSLNSTTSVNARFNLLQGGSGTYTAAAAASNAIPITFGAGDFLNLKFKVPILGWDQSNFMIGQFNGLETCANTYECTDEFTANISSAGVVSGENVDWINGNCSVSTAEHTCNYLTNTLNGNGVGLSAGMVCLGVDTSSTTTAQAVRIYTSSTTGFVGSSNSGRSWSVTCRKTFPDYLGKTAKAVASDQNVATPGVLKAEVFSFDFGASLATICTSTPCYVDQVGAAISSIPRAGVGSYTLNFSKTYSKVKCVGNARGASAIYFVQINPCNSSCSSTSMAVFTTAGANVDGFGNIVCHGYTP